MKEICWKGKPFKKLSYGKTQNAGRNYSGQITVYHRGGGAKRLLRRIDLLRNFFPSGIVERIEYDPNRSSRIALIRWNHFLDSQGGLGNASDFSAPVLENNKKRSFFSYIIACNNLKSGDVIWNLHLHDTNDDFSNLGPDSALMVNKNPINDKEATSYFETKNIDRKINELSKINRIENKLTEIKTKTPNFFRDINVYQRIGNNCILEKLPLGSIIHNIELSPGKGGQLVRAAGTFGQLVQKFANGKQCMIRLPSGGKLLLDSKNRATLGVVSNENHNTRKLKKAGQSRWLGRLPVVRGVAMNPVDHPHGGGEGRTKGGRPSVSPWGKPTKGPRRRNRKGNHARSEASLAFGLVS